MMYGIYISLASQVVLSSVREEQTPARGEINLKALRMMTINLIAINLLPIKLINDYNNKLDNNRLNKTRLHINQNEGPEAPE